MHGSPRISTDADNLEDVHSYNSHSDHVVPVQQYDNGHCNKAFSSSKEKDLNDIKMNETVHQSPNKSPMNRVNSPLRNALIDEEVCLNKSGCSGNAISSLPLADSLMKYRINDYSSKVPLVPADQRSNERIIDSRHHSCSSVKNDVVKDKGSRASETDVIVFSDIASSFPNKTLLKRRQSRGVQAWPTPPYRLKVLPKNKDGKSFKINFNLLGRWAFCQIGLASLLLLWALAGATAFRYTEGPGEEKAAQELVTKQKHLVTGLTKELKQDILDEADWYKTIEKYMYRHEKVLAEIGNSGQGQGTGGHVWTFPGCILFAVSLITTLGFGAPVPRTSEGRGVAIAFAAIGIPLHLLLVLNIGMAIAIKLQSYALRRRKYDDESREPNEGLQELEDKVLEPKCNANGIFSISRHKRSGSEPIGKQAMNNIATQANFSLEETNESKYCIMESESSEKQITPRNDTKGDCDLNNVRFSQDMKNVNESSDLHPHSMPSWLKWLPFLGIFFYYTMGFLLFGIARTHPFLESLMFPLDFTVAGGVAHTEGYIRVLYAIYLEGAVVLAAITVSILQVSATQGLTDLGLKYGLLTNSR